MSEYKLLSYRSARGARAGLLVDGHVHDAARATREPRYASVLGILQDWPAARAALKKAARRPGKGLALEKLKLLAPILYPGAIFCAGANYTDHMEEMARAAGQPPGPTMKELGEAPWHFVKTPASVVGAGAIVKLPAYSHAVDWEVELAVVIGRSARNVPAERALGYVAGYTIANDLSARDAMRREKLPAASPFRYDWLSQKCFDGACPMGPWIVPAEQVGDPQQLGIRLWVNDELMQDSNTGKMIFSAAEQIAMLSSRVTLCPGDVVLTGTPAGVGMPRRRFLGPGDRVRLWVERIGELTHRVA